MSDYWSTKRIIITGGSGFLGSFVVEKLQRAGAKEVFVPRHSEYDLHEWDRIHALLSKTKPDIVFHLAASVGGIGANLAYLAKFFYDNLMMDVQLVHECWRVGVPKLVIVGTVCAYPKFTPVPFKEENLWNGYPGVSRGNQRPLRTCQGDAIGATGVSAAVRVQIDFPTAHQSVWAAR